MTEERRRVKEWLRDLRGETTQQEIADALGVSLKTISNMENPRQGFPNGLTMVRYLELVGAINPPPAPSGSGPALGDLMAEAAELLGAARRKLRELDQEAESV